MVKVLTESGADVNVRTRAGATPIYYAVWSDKDVATLLLTTGAKPELVSLEGDMPLSVAAWLGYTDIVRECLAQGASPFVTDRNTGHAFMWAAQRGHIDIIDAILERFPNGIDVYRISGLGSNEPDFADDAPDLPDLVRYRRSHIAKSTSLGRTALIAATLANQRDMIEHLLTKGADPNLSDRSGMSPLHYATNLRPTALETVNTLLQWGAAIDKVDHLGNTALIDATIINEPALLAALLKAGANPEIEDRQGFAAMHHAASWGKTEAIKALCSLGRADTGHFDRQGLTPLHLAASFKEPDIDVFAALIDGGSSPNLKTKSGDTVLSVLLRSGHRDQSDKARVARYLIERGADAWLANSDGYIAVLEAAINGQEDFCGSALSAIDLAHPQSISVLALACATALGMTDLVASLIEAGVPFNQVIYRGLRPLSLAALLGHLPVVNKLLLHGAPVNWATKYPSALTYASLKGHVAVVSRLLEAGANPNASGPDDMIPIILAVNNGHTEVVDRLLCSRAFPDIRTPRGMTPLHVSAVSGHVDIGEKLVNAGADLEALDKDGDRPLHFAAMNKQSEFVSWLLSKDVLPDPENENGHQPLHAAARVGVAGVFRRLAEAGADIQAADDEGNTPLHYASMNGSVEIVAWLLDKTVALDGKNKQGQRAVDLASTHMVLAEFQKHEIVPTILEHPLESDRAAFLRWEPVPATSLDRIARLVARSQIDKRIIQTLETEVETQFRWARLPFYNNAMILAVPITAYRSPNEFFVVVAETHSYAIQLDWTNEPIFKCNETLGWNVNAETAVLYLKYFFFFVRGKLGRFNIIENASELSWLETAPENLLASANACVRVVSLKENAPNNMLCFVLTCAFKNALFETEAYLALVKLQHKWPDEEDMTSFEVGQFHLRNEEVLLDDLPISVPGPPTEFR